MRDRRRAARQAAARRGELGLSQQQLAEAAGVDSKTIGNFETRGRWPIARTRTRIERALGWPAGELDRLAESSGASEVPELVPQDEWERLVLADETLPHHERAEIVLRSRKVRERLYPALELPQAPAQEHPEQGAAAG